MLQQRQEVTDTSSKLFLAVDAQKSIKSDDIFLEEPNKVLTGEQVFYIELLLNGVFPLATSGFPTGIPIKVAPNKLSHTLASPILGAVPDSSLTNLWSSVPYTTFNMRDSFNTIALQVKAARKVDFGSKLTVDPHVVDHPEDIDFSDNKNLESHFFYMYKPGLTPRRIEMLADLAVYRLRKALEIKELAILVDFGPGLFCLEQTILKKITPQERSKVHIVCIDVSEDLLRYGLLQSFTDSAFVADICKTQFYFLNTLLAPDVVVFAEILEHIDHDGIVFKEKVLPWIKSNDSFLIGSVPNALQLAEFLPIITGSGSSHQLRRPIMDVTNDHHSHHTAATLVELLTQTWGFSESGVVSNGVRVQKNGDTAMLRVGLTSPQLGDRLIFWAN